MTNGIMTASKSRKEVLNLYSNIMGLKKLSQSLPCLLTFLEILEVARTHFNHLRICISESFQKVGDEMMVGAILSVLPQPRNFMKDPYY